MAKPDATPPRRPGRPPSTTRDELAALALALFSEEGFEETSLDRIAEAAGINRRTILRYFDSKNDIVWGGFSEHLQELRNRLGDAEPGEPTLTVIRREVIAFNDYRVTEIPALRRRMLLITTVPVLQGHATLRYAEWRAVIAVFAAQRLGVEPQSLAPQLLANSALAVALTAYGRWIQDPAVDLLEELARGFSLTEAGFSEKALLTVARA